MLFLLLTPSLGPPPSVGSTITTYNEHLNAVSAVAWSPDGKELASAGLDTTVQIWNASTGKALLTYIGHAASVTATAWSPDGQHLASVGFDKTVQVWNAATGRPLWIYCCQGWVNGITWSPDGTRLASGDDDGIVRVWQAPVACQCASDATGHRECLVVGGTSAHSSYSWERAG